MNSARHISGINYRRNTPSEIVLQSVSGLMVGHLRLQGVQLVPALGDHVRFNDTQGEERTGIVAARAFDYTHSPPVCTLRIDGLNSVELRNRPLRPVNDLPSQPRSLYS